MPYFLNMLARNSSFKIAEAGHTEMMLIRQLGDSINFIDIQIASQGEILITSIQSQNHGLAHAGIGGAGREAKVEMEIHITRNMDDTAFNDQHIITF